MTCELILVWVGFVFCKCIQIGRSDKARAPSKNGEIVMSSSL